ncbi:c-type cytochrome [Thalassotalea sp. G2M2-11]|uniref:c-type cytochrome n=1 Tax=Thalassotalea sp. G2M2-11 TaxID=2787627 RepID=UPI001F49EF51|nr:c-type cytochrome [Thalassotalea sp. G2M2-11]
MKNVLMSIVIGLGMLSHANAFEGDAAAGKTKAATCAGCHGANGIGIMGAYPNLAGQHADYIVKQLKAFKAGDRADPVMAPMAAALSEQDMQDVAAYFASFGRDGAAPAGATAAADESAAPSAPTATVAAAPVADASAGKALYEHGDQARGITACVDCHGKEGNSKVLINPNLANQHPEYIAKQLKAFKAESRHNASMNQVSGNLTDADIANLAAYFDDTSAVGEVAASAGKVAVKSFAGDVDAGKAKSATCIACHGADGNATVAIYPSLAGQSETYLAKQLHEFKSGVRDNAVMAGMAAALSDEDIKNVAAYFAAQTLKPAPANTSAAGKQLYVSGDAKRGISACIACHSVNGGGMDKAGFPAVAGQSAAYIKSQLEQFRSGTRANDNNGIMRNIAVKLSDKDIAALADYMAALK